MTSIQKARVGSGSYSRSERRRLVLGWCRKVQKTLMSAKTSSSKEVRRSLGGKTVCCSTAHLSHVIGGNHYRYQQGKLWKSIWPYATNPRCQCPGINLGQNCLALVPLYKTVVTAGEWKCRHCENWVQLVEPEVGGSGICHTPVNETENA